MQCSSSGDVGKENSDDWKMNDEVLFSVIKLIYEFAFGERSIADEKIKIPARIESLDQEEIRAILCNIIS